VRRFSSNRSQSLEARLRQLEDWAPSVRPVEDSTDATGGGAAAVILANPPSGSPPTTLTGDVSGLLTANTVNKIKGVPVDTPVAGDDQQFAQYDLSSGTIRWVNVTAPVFPIRTITVSGAATIADGVILVDATLGAVTVTLPAVATMTGRVLVVKKKDTSANAVILDGNGAETVDDLATFPFATPYTAISVISNGVAWWVI
jgi:hypothetical protein